MELTNEKMLEHIKIAVNALDDKLATDITVLDISQQSVLTDFFIICTANNQNHMKTLSETADENLSKCGLTLRHLEGLNSREWILQDYGHIIIHIFTGEMREFYDLEEVWKNAKVVEI